jgi:sentrin-specific protease 1
MNVHPPVSSPRSAEHTGLTSRSGRTSSPGDSTLSWESSCQTPAIQQETKEVISTLSVFGDYVVDSIVSLYGWVKEKVFAKPPAGIEEQEIVQGDYLGKRAISEILSSSHVKLDNKMHASSSQNAVSIFRNRRRHRSKSREGQKSWDSSEMDQKQLSEIAELPSITDSSLSINKRQKLSPVSPMESDKLHVSFRPGMITASNSPAEDEEGSSILDLEELSNSTSLLKQKQLKSEKLKQSLPPKSPPGITDMIDISESEEDSSGESDPEPHAADDDKQILQRIERMVLDERMKLMEDQFELNYRQEPFFVESEKEIIRFTQSKFHLEERVMGIKEYLQMKCLLRVLGEPKAKSPKTDPRLPRFPPSSIISQYPMPEFDDMVDNPMLLRLKLAESGKASQGCFKSIVNTRNACMTLPGEWLNDEIVNGYVDLINLRTRGGCNYPTEMLTSNKRPPFVQNQDDHCLNTFFFLELKRPKPDMNKISRMLVKREVDIKTIRRLFIPLHQGGNHWVFIVLDMQKVQITFYDSLGSGDLPQKDAQAATFFMKWILDQRGASSGSKNPSKAPSESTMEDSNSWSPKLVTAVGNPKQKNTCDCGVFMLKGIDYLIRFNKLDFSQSDMRYFRICLLYELLYPERPLGMDIACANKKLV